MITDSKVRFLDLFGAPVNLNIFNSRSFKSIFGAVMTIMSFILFFGIFVWKMSSFVN
jgi:hypothetical protein